MRAWLLILAIFGMLGCKTLKEGVELTFTEEEIQQKLGKKFPKTEKIYGVVPVVIDEPVVQFVEGEDRVQLSLAARIEVPFKGTYQAALKFSSGIDYDEEKKALNLTKIEVEEMEATKLPEKYEPALTILSTMLAQKYLEGHEIYRLKDSDLKKKAARYLIKDVEVEGEKLVVKLGL